MNSESACTSEQKTFCTEMLSFKNIPNQSRLFLDFEGGSSNVENFYAAKFSDDYIAEVLANYKTDRDALCGVLKETNESFGAGEKTLEHISLLNENDCVAIVTGQQAGLFSGALYTIYKALSAIRLAEDLRKRDIKAVPVFWIAEEDHDFDEVKKTFLLNGSGKLAEIENVPQNAQANSPVGFIEFDEKIEETERRVFEELAQTEFSDEIKKLLLQTYQKGETFSSAFAKFLTKLFGKYGLIIFSPLNEKLKKMSSPIYVEAVQKADEIRDALLERTAELESKNYHVQVLVEKDFFPFFIFDGKKRFALKKNSSGNYAAKKTKLEFSPAELMNLAKAEPQKLSPNALMRSIAQDYLLPTAVYFGGAAEIAYFAQNAEIYRVLNRPLTPIRHRASFTVVEPKNRRTLEKYNLKINDLFTGKDEVSARVVNEFLANKTAAEFAETEENFKVQLNHLEKSLAEIEPTLAANLEMRRRKILYHVAALQKKFQHAELRKNETSRRRLEFLFESLLPHKALQERSLNVLYFLNSYGENFVDWIYEAVSVEDKEHQIFYL